GADGGPGRVVVVELEVGGPVGVHVAGEHDRVAHPGVDPALGDAAAGGDVAVPGVLAGDLDGTLVPVTLGEEHLLADDVPAGARAAPAVAQPLLLAGPGDGAVRVGGLGAVLEAVAAALVVAVLAGVEHVEDGGLSPPHAPVNPHVDAAGDGGPAQRHVLVIGAEGGLAAGEEAGLRPVGALGHLPGPVVVDLVVVPDDQPGRRGVRGPQV